MITRRILLSATLSALLAAALSACDAGGQLRGLAGIDLTGKDIGTDFTLSGADGKPHTLSEYRGKAIMIFFGFTQCPDICPTSMARAADVKRMLGPEGERLQVLFITIDPERDTSEILAAYTAAFDPEFLGLYGTPDQIARVAKAFKAFYQKVPTGSSYTMDHTSLSYLYDPQGRLRVAMRHTQTAEEFASDIRKLLALTR